jgi:NADP-dependent 3-hydroxy acid dehydrogenase YdfG
VNSTMLITGASSGIGEATAKYFLAKGWNVAATMRSPDLTGSWATGTSVFCPRLDLSDPTSIATAIYLTLERFGRIDVLVNNAGYALMGPMEGVTTEQFSSFKQMCLALLLRCKRFYHYFERRDMAQLSTLPQLAGGLAFR